MGKVGTAIGRGGKFLVKEYVSSKLGELLGYPLGIEDPIDQVICASIYLNSYILELTGDKLEVWFYQQDNPDLGAHAEATFQARLKFDFLPHKDAAIRDKVRTFAGCDTLPPAGPAPGKKVQWEVDGRLTDHGSMLPIESVTDSGGTTTSDFQVGTGEDVPKSERRQVETFSGMVQATAVGLLPTYDKLELLVRGLRPDTSNPQRARLPLLLSHYIRPPAYILRYTAEMMCKRSGTKNLPTGQEEWTYEHDIRLRSEIRLIRSDKPEVFAGGGPLVYEPGSDMRYRNVGWGIAGDSGDRCDHVITWRLTGLPPSTATATLRLTPRQDFLLDVSLEFSPGSLHEQEEQSYVTTAGPCPSNTNTWNSGYALSVFRSAHPSPSDPPVATITDWRPGTGDVLATSTLTTGDPAASGGRYIGKWELIRPEED